MKLICMSFDGDYVTEGTFDSTEDAWERSNDMGSRWFFYPFHFVTTESGKTIKDACYPLDALEGRRVSTVKRLFKQTADRPGCALLEPFDFSFAVLDA
jgi:hypothetical protein